jgi:uncharacterized secreted protein with C-terminal beta-propeller domain
VRSAIVVPAVLALVTQGAGCTGDPPAPGPDGHPAPGQAALAAFEDCFALDLVAREAATRRAAPRSRPGGPAAAATDRAVASAGGAEAAPAPDRPGAGSPAATWGGTNLREVGVDEPDLVKTDGRRLLAVADGTLRAVDLTGPVPVAAGALPLDEETPTALLVDGDTAVLLGTAAGGPVPPPVGPGPTVELALPPTPATTLTVVDVADPAAMAVRSRTELDGAVVDARMVDGTVRLVLTSTPTAATLRTTGGAEAGAWLPRFRTTDADGTVRSSGPLLSCEAVHHPDRPLDPTTVSVVTLDLREPDPRPVADVAVLGGGDTVYATARSLYVAATTWDTPTAATAVHRFAIEGRDPARYLGSGTVRGTLVDQFSLSEDGSGRLRVATTDTDGAVWESFVTVLADDGTGALATVGQVGGLGLTERIMSVRFLDELAYVVTFRRTDPLYTVDLSDPGAPRVVGELKIPGYSGYLHPVGDGRLLGVGRDADDEGRLRGLQVSLFDVTDPAAPTRLDALVLPDATSPTETDHHAFAWFPDDELLVLPVEAHGAGAFAGALGVTVRGADLAERGWIRHRGPDPWTAAVRRALVVDGGLYTVSAAGLQVADPATLAERAWLAWPWVPRR